MAMKRCPICGEKYSDTYRDCPFCEEEDALLDGEEIRRSPRRRGSRSRQFNIITPTLIVLILIMAALLIYLLFGDKWGEKKQQEEETNTPPVTDSMPEAPVQTEPDSEEGGTTMPEESQGGETTELPTSETDYDTAMVLPDGLSLSTTDFTLKKTGETHTISVSGGSGTYRWVSQDEGIASVDKSGKVTAVSKGTVNVVVTDGSKKGVCIVRVTASGTGTGTTTTSGSGLAAGKGQVSTSGGPVNVRPSAGTDLAPIASLKNGDAVEIIRSAGDGWYEITFAGDGGKTTTGYMKGDYLKNK